jgi:hypothetical protein
VSWTLPCDVLCVGLANGGRNISRSLKLLCLKRNIENLSAIQEKSGYLFRQRGIERFVGHPEVIPDPAWATKSCLVTWRLPILVASGDSVMILSKKFFVPETLGTISGQLRERKFR